MKRFLDDIFKIFVGTTKQLHQFFDEMNQIHPTLKFTFNHTSPSNERIEDKCECNFTKSISYLGVTVTIISMSSTWNTATTNTN